MQHAHKIRHANSNCEIITGADCPLRGGPCRAGMAFMERLDAGLRLAQGVTGQVPSMAGEIVLETCPACAPCRLQWRVEQGFAALSDGTRVLLRSNPGADRPSRIRP
jgi:hypothetical protein